MEYTDKDIQRFWTHVDKSDDCWIWTGVTRNGYGMIGFGPRSKRRLVSAHRFSFCVANSGINESLQVRHKCDNRPCVRPDHLEQGTALDNSNDKMNRDRHHGTLRNTQVEEIRKIPMSRTILYEVSQRYGVSEEFARNVLDGTTYRHLPGARKVVRQKSRSKLSIEQIREIKQALRTPYWGQVNDLARKYGVGHPEISHIKTGRIHADVTDTHIL